MDSGVLLAALLRPLFAVGTVWLLHRLVKIFYNLFLHPLRDIPGPRLAAATYLPEFYYDVVCVGKYTAEIGKMHEEYGEIDTAQLPGPEMQGTGCRSEYLPTIGPLVRINPNEVHCNDPDFIDEIYAVGGRKRNKPVHQVTASA